MTKLPADAKVELVARLRQLRVILKSGDYDGADLMSAWCAMADAADIIEAALEQSDAEQGEDYCGIVVTDEDAVSLIAAERRRQIEAEGWTPEHDDEHVKGELADAAACYAAGTLLEAPRSNHRAEWHDKIWPWGAQWWKPSDRRRDLVKAGALIVAEIERLDRVASRPHSTGR